MAERDFRDALKRGAILFDGATGTLLYERGVFLNRCFEELNLSNPDIVRSIHADYAKAGAMVVETNTYGANRITLRRHGFDNRVEEINRAGVRLAREAVGDEVFVGASVGPTGVEPTLFVSDPKERERALEAFREQVSILAEEDADLIVLETFSSLNELLLALEASKDMAPEMPVVAQMMFQENGIAADGSVPEQVAHALVNGGADVVGGNCGGGPQEIYEIARRMLGRGRPVSAQANAGRPQAVEGRQLYLANPEYFAVFARRLLKIGVRCIGGCCGTRPHHVQAMAGAVRMFGHEWTPPRRNQERSGPIVIGVEPTPLAERSELGERIAARRFSVSVEVNPPEGLDPSRAIEAARMLKAGGIHVINIADGPRASVRMSNLSMAVKVQEEVGMEVILHVCCRDRNLLGLQSHLLGAWVLGIRNTVIITGDPPKMGDYPDATGVYDLDSVGLLKLLRNYNRGVDPAGKLMPQPTTFVMATGAEPAALNYERELQRLEAKAKAGAEFVMTQPVYDPEVMSRFLDDLAARGIDLPVYMGLLPLASHRNAEFLNREVPGMKVPEAIRERMRKAGSGKAGRAEGVRIAREALEAARDRIAGAYIMPPLGRYQLALAVVDGFLDTDDDESGSEVPGREAQPDLGSPLK